MSQQDVTQSTASIVMKVTGYRNYLLLMLLFIQAFNCVDRLAVGLVSQQIKLELSLSDTQIGILNGIGFTLMYGLMSIPLASWGDRGNRVLNLSLTTFLWSVSVVLSGFARNFPQLLGSRMAAAAWQGGVTPVCSSLLTDYFTRAELPRAMSRVLLSGPLSYLIGDSLAGWIGNQYGWRTTMVAMGLPGLGLAALAWFTMREPRLERSTCLQPATSTSAADQRSAANSGSAQESAPALMRVWVALWRNRTYRYLLLANLVLSLSNFGAMQWQPTLFMRSYGLGIVEAGNWFAAIYGLTGVIGLPLGGMLASRFAGDNQSLQLKGMAVLYAATGIISVFIYLTSNAYLAFALLALSMLLGSMAAAPCGALVPLLVAPRMRAQATAIYWLLSFLIGMGLSPLIVGALSDGLGPIAGQESLRYALLATCPGVLWAGWYLWIGHRTVRGDLPAAGVSLRGLAS